MLKSYQVVGWGGVVVAHKILVSAPVPWIGDLVLGLDKNYTLPDILKADWVDYAEADKEHIGVAIGKGPQSVVVLLTCCVIQIEYVWDSAGKRK